MGGPDVGQYRVVDAAAAAAQGRDRQAVVFGGPGDDGVGGQGEEASNAVMGLLAGARMAAHMLQLTEGTAHSPAPGSFLAIRTHPHRNDDGR